jgi:hypothetical protein
MVLKLSIHYVLVDLVDFLIRWWVLVYMYIDMIILNSKESNELLFVAKIMIMSCLLEMLINSSFCSIEIHILGVLDTPQTIQVFGMS